MPVIWRALSNMRSMAMCSSTTAAARFFYATDSSNYRQVPIGVVRPKSIDDVVKGIALCRKFGAPVLARGGGTSLAGQCCNVAVIFDFTRYLQNIHVMDFAQKRAVVDPGIVLDTVRNAAEKEHLYFRAGSGNARPLHDWRYDRQQLVRHARADGREDGRQCRAVACADL